MSIAGAGAPRRRDQEGPLSRRVASWLGWWVGLMSLWLLLVDSVAVPELLAGAAVAALAATLVELGEYQAHVRNSVRAEWIAAARRLPLEVLRDTWLVLRVGAGCLAGRRPPASALHVVPVDGGGDSPEDATRRALLVLGTSVSPNSVVLGVDAESGLMVLHRLVPPPRPRPGERPLRQS